MASEQDKETEDIKTLQKKLEGQLRFNRLVTVCCFAAVIASMATLLFQIICAMPAFVYAARVGQLRPMVVRWKEIEREIAAREEAASSSKTSTEPRKAEDR